MGLPPCVSETGAQGSTAGSPVPRPALPPSQQPLLQGGLRGGRAGPVHAQVMQRLALRTHLSHPGSWSWGQAHSILHFLQGWLLRGPRACLEGTTLAQLCARLHSAHRCSDVPEFAESTR